jgi:putative oxidoreductase
MRRARRLCRAYPASAGDIARLLLARLLAPSTPTASVAATLFRLGAGAIFLGFGLSKFTHHAREAAAFDRYGLPDPSVFAYATGSLELGLGALLVVGLAVRLAAPALAGNMVGAIATGGRVDGGFVNLGLAPALLLVMLYLVWAGAGRWSLDGRLLRRVGTRPTSRLSPR